jgi:hypothetical protein
MVPLHSDGMKTGSLPVTVDTGSIKFQADLQLRVQLGLEAKGSEVSLPIGAGAVVAVYANVIEVIAEVSYTPECPVAANIEYNFNFGAYAQASIALNGTELGVSPTASTTLFKAPILSTCFVTGTASSSAASVVPRTALGQRAVREGPITLPPRAVEQRTLRAPAVTNAPSPRAAEIHYPRDHVVPASVTLTSLPTPEVHPAGQK